jgi:uncharacterized membrane protein
MSLFPFTTAWVGRNIFGFLPEFLYLLVIAFWSAAFTLMQKELIREGEYEYSPTFGRGRQTIYYGIIGLGFFVVWIWPAYVLISMIPFIFENIYTQMKYGGRF